MTCYAGPLALLPAWAQWAVLILDTIIFAVAALVVVVLGRAWRRQ